MFLGRPGPIPFAHGLTVTLYHSLLAIHRTVAGCGGGRSTLIGGSSCCARTSAPVTAMTPRTTRKASCLISLSTRGKLGTLVVFITATLLIQGCDRAKAPSRVSPGVVRGSSASD